MSRWRDHGLYDRPFGIGQITGVTKATALRRKAVFGCPHRALLKRESSARQGITSDSSDSRTSRIGSKSDNESYDDKLFESKEVILAKDISETEVSIRVRLVSSRPIKNFTFYLSCDGSVSNILAFNFPWPNPWPW